MLNRQKFEWNHSDFNQLFQSTETAVDFVTVFQEVERFDSERGYFVPKPVCDTDRKNNLLMKRIRMMMRMKKKRPHLLTSEQT